ncbi:MAG: polysaccharide deacetylase family protein [Acidobacteriota bacterium]|nr:polysaccharide deacetylase family protein [Acidobacteriota bacterium]
MTDRLRHTVRFLAAAVLYYSGIAAVCRHLRRKGGRGELTVLGFHRVLTVEQRNATGSEASMVVLLETFRRLLELLRRDFEVVTLASVESGDLALGKKPRCLLTFDDAWLDTFANAAPALREAGLTAVVFVPTGLIGSQGTFWVERLTSVWRQGEAAQSAARRAVGRDSADLSGIIAAMKELPLAAREACLAALCREHAALDSAGIDRFMTWEQLEESAQVLEVGSHTVRHVLLDKEDEATARRELVESRIALSLKTKHDVRSLAYPNGNHNASVRQWTREAGYDWAFTVRPGIFHDGEDRLQVPRMLIQESNLTNPWSGFSPAMAHFRLLGWR